MEIWKKMWVGVFFLNTLYFHRPILGGECTSGSGLCHVNKTKQAVRGGHQTKLIHAQTACLRYIWTQVLECEIIIFSMLRDSKNYCRSAVSTSRRKRCHFNVTTEGLKGTRRTKLLYISTAYIWYISKLINETIIVKRRVSGDRHCMRIWWSNKSPQLVPFQHNKSKTCRKTTDKRTAHLDRIHMIHL